MEDERKFVELSDENGNKMKLELLFITQINGRNYVVFYPTDPNDTKVIILRAQESEDHEQVIYEEETNQEIVQEVYQRFKERYEGEILFKDE